MVVFPDLWFSKGRIESLLLPHATIPLLKLWRLWETTIDRYRVLAVMLYDADMFTIPLAEAIYEALSALFRSLAQVGAEGLVALFPRLASLFSRSLGPVHRVGASSHTQT